MVCIEKRPHILYGRSSAPHFRYLTCLLDRGHITCPVALLITEGSPASRQLFRAAKHSSILCDRESSICFFLDEASKFCKVVKQILILVAVAGKDVENQRLGIWHKKRVLVGEPFHIIKIWL